MYLLLISNILVSIASQFIFKAYNLSSKLKIVSIEFINIRELSRISIREYKEYWHYSNIIYSFNRQLL